MNTPQPKRLSQAISVIVHPFFTPIYALAVLLFGDTFYSLLSVGYRFYILGIIALYCMVVPAVAIALMKVWGIVSDFELYNRSERILPQLLTLLCYVLCTITISRITHLPLLNRVLTGAIICMVLCLALTPLWKISMHLTSAGAMTGFFTVMSIGGMGDFTWWLVGSVAASGALASARLYLGCHNGGQVLAGFCGGFFIMVGAMLLM